jgi:hypothetical protein
MSINTFEIIKWLLFNDLQLTCYLNIKKYANQCPKQLTVKFRAESFP